MAMASERGGAPALVSVVIPTRDRRDLVLRALRSVLEQQPAAPLQAIVVDDGSSDGTAEALRLHHGDDARVELLATTAGNASAARNRGFAAARGQFVCFLDSDDCWLPGLLADVRAVFAHHPGLAFVSVDGSTQPAGGAPALQRVVSGDAPGWSHPRFPHRALVRETIALPGGRRAALVRGDFLPGIVNGDLFYLSGLVMRRDAALAAGPFNERFRYYNDWEFFARLCLQGEGAYLDYDGFRRDTGRADQISRNRPLTAMPRRHLFILRALSRRRGISATYADALRPALLDAQYRMGVCLAAAARRRRARMYFYTCIKNRHKPWRALLRLALAFVLPRRPRRTGW